MTRATDCVVTHRWLPAWLRVAGYNAPEDDPGKIQGSLTALGINSRTWKLYGEYGDGLIRPLGPRWLSPDRPLESLSNAIAYLRLLNGCEVDIAPPPEMVAALAVYIPLGQSIAAMPVAVFRGAWRALVQAGYRGTSARAFVETEVIPVMRWFFEQQSSIELDANRNKAAWAWLRRRWEEERRRRALPPKNTEWHAPLREAHVGNLRFMALQCLAALEDEGEVMRHCVAALGDCCKKGCVHVYSVRNAVTLDRLATLAVRSQLGSWVIADLKAEKNALPDESVTRAALRFLSCISESAQPPALERDKCEGCLV